MLYNISLEIKRKNLYIRYYYDEKKTLFNLGIQIDAIFCDKKNNIILQSHPEASKFNYQINLLSDKIRDAVVILKHQGIEPLPDEVRNLVLNTDSQNVKADFWQFFDKFLQQKKGSIRPSTFTNYLKLKRLLLEFQESCNYKISFTSFNSKFYTLFQNFFISRNLQVNYFANTILTLNSVLKNANFSNIKLHNDISKKYFSVSKKTPDSVYLSENELSKLIELDLSYSISMQRCRDLFIIGAYTGLRYSDVCQLSDDKIQNNSIKIRHIKTGKWVNIPIHPAINNIVNKWGTFPKAIDHSDFNKRIKKIAQKAGINQIVSSNKYIGIQVIESKLPKYELISSHTMRRSFITNLHHKGMPLRNIMDFSGHSTMSSLERYLKSDLNESSNLLINIWNI